MTMQTRRLIQAIPFLLLAASLAEAQSLSSCAEIKDPDARLQCFDQLAGTQQPQEQKAAPQKTPEPAAAIVPASPAPAAATVAGPKPAPVNPQPATVEAKPAPASDQPQPEATSTPGISSYDELFGLENEAAKRGIKEIQSRITDDFTGWNGNTVFHLENGQVWQQYDQSSRMAWRGVEHPIAIIKRKSFGSYMLGVEGLNKMVRVKRIK